MGSFPRHGFAGFSAIFLAIFSAIFLAILAFAPPAWSQQPPLRVALAHSEPWAYYSKDGEGERKSQLVGILVDITRELSRETGLSMAPYALPYGRIGRELQNGDCDLTYMIRSDDRDAYVDYVGYLFKFYTLVIAKPGSTLKSYEDLAGLRIGIIKDTRLHARFDADASLSKVEVRDYETLVDMFLSGRLDAIAGNSVSLHHLLHKRGYTDPVWPRLILQKTEVWAQMPKKSPHLGQIVRLRQAIDKLRNEGHFEAGLQRFRPGENWIQANRSSRDAASLPPALLSPSLLTSR